MILGEDRALARMLQALLTGKGARACFEGSLTIVLGRPKSNGQVASTQAWMTEGQSESWWAWGESNSRQTV